MSSNNTRLKQQDRQILLETARASSAAGLDGRSLQVSSGEYSLALQALRASFVTIEIESRLRGCIGVLEAKAPLIEDVSDNAYRAAFGDPRFTPLSRQEFEHIDIHLSVLSLPERMQFTAEADLLAQIRVGVDGLILEEGSHRSTFLPSVWDKLREPDEFLRQLKRKAGLSGDYWSDTIVFQRYTAESIP